MPISFLDLINNAMKGGSQPPVVFSDAQASVLARGVWPRDGAQNSSGASQSISAAVRTYITGTALTFPLVPVRVGASFKWRFNLTKDANGTAASTFDICVGTTGTTSDTARVSFTKPAGTAVADEGWVEINAIVRTAGASGILVAEFVFDHNLAATGHMTIPQAVVLGTSSAFDLSAINLIFGICLTSGAADNITTTLVTSEATAF